MLKCLLSILFLSIIYLGKSEVTSLQDIELPKIFHFNETQQCAKDQVFCKLDIKLKPINEDNPPEIWKRIEKINNGSRRFYRRDIIYRGNCINKFLLEKSHDEYEKYGLMGNVEYFHCMEEAASISYDTADVVFGATVLCYIIFLIYSSVTAYKAKKNGKKVDKYVKIFSVINIWEDIRKPNRSEDFQRLLSIQGMRTFTMVFIITIHTFIKFVLSYSFNPEYVENLYEDIWTLMWISSSGLLVQVYFIISSWLLAVQLQSIVKKNKKITLKDILLLALNRYFRLIPAVLVITCITKSKSAEWVAQPMYKPIVREDIQRCKTDWWKNFFFIQNVEIIGGDICSPGTWYIAADTQMYLLVLILFYLSHKLKISLKYCLIIIASITIFIQGYIVLITNYDGLLRFSPRLLLSESYFSHPEVRSSYISTITNIPTYFIGFMFGNLYSKHNQNNIFNTPMKKICWLAGFLGLPFLAIRVYFNRDFNDDSRGLEALMSVSLRPLFATGIAIGLLGMSTGTGGFLKSFFECKLLVFLGNFTYSVYMFHFGNVFGRLVWSNKMTLFNDNIFRWIIITDVVSSFIIGIMMYVILEHPCVQIQKMLLPQVKTNEVGYKKK